MNPAFRKKIKRNDRIAYWVITLGGMAIIFSVIFILILIAEVSLPLFLSPDAELHASNRIENAEKMMAVGMDEYMETGYTIDEDGEIHFFNIVDGSELDRSQLAREAGRKKLIDVDSYGRLNHSLLWEDGSLTIEQVVFRPFFDEANDNKRSILHQVDRLAEFPAPPVLPQQSLARADDEGRKVRVDLFADNRLQLQLLEVTEDFLGNEEVTEAEHLLEVHFKGKISALELSNNGRMLYAGSDQGELCRWDLSDAEEPVLLETLQGFADQRAISSLGLVFGDVSLAVGDVTGQVTTWFPVRNDSGTRVLTRIHDLSQHSGPVQALSPSPHDKSVISFSDDGLHLDHMTSERFLLALGEKDSLTSYAMTTRGNAMIGLAKDGRLISWKLDIPHPEISFGTLFGKVWYEGYDEPTYAWQSSAATDDYEPKLSLTPLIFGTLKGTFYAMLFAVPLAILGAIYTSQFARPRLRELIKPAVEVMAAIPTVIIGFLAALWLAPLIERSLGSMFLSLIMVPAALMISIAIWQAARKVEPLKRVERGFEFLAIAPIAIMAVAFAAVLGPGLENWLFAGDLKQWLFTEMDTRYDPRNCIIIAFAMGFAVIPIIFTIAEDSLSNVPNSLKAASLALGASRWQTVWRVILPSASPGIFAGTMIGFGRAVGETMIVLMATGNTAIMDLSIFNGMRPLSANIAVEIPEAPVDGSLYRTLFLSAVILFVMTFVVNTVAEIVRQRLRAKYGRF
ncbi:phosphate transport system permease protein [Malonomonas rubra DSM 5091]|uniref:Phosphate transport system permease protein n=1 Tax=Malonomonas rubra DSM 5091 TaxID=1122189 RepID=A0A1M6H649_MALRU|nr:ABC transporter permease subunit [Malonomonas rubra]SHJ17685.1 phosphate transport system permease protein [Malonomonas rubra DSM 5091]